MSIPIGGRYLLHFYELVWTNVPLSTLDKAPDTDREIDVSQAQSILVQGDTTNASNASTSFDINVEASLDGVHWDTVPYAETNYGDNEVKSFVITPGAKKIRLRGDNNDTANAAYVTARVLVRT